MGSENVYNPPWENPDRRNLIGENTRTFVRPKFSIYIGFYRGSFPVVNLRNTYVGGILRGKLQYHYREIITLVYSTWKTPISFPWDYYVGVFYVEKVNNDSSMRFLRWVFTWKNPISRPQWDFYDRGIYVEKPNIDLRWKSTLHLLARKKKFHFLLIITFSYKRPKEFI
jgi:hypothetical protein